ncbi:oligopeptide transporter 5 [Cryptomeria japonica]|uniref:oligopeptide transporter 5 n=1 Tax=Cryptomeria japonica TaxID=3369 RepID=UPI0025AB6FA2|nr:oligopeptide transporter 5 [Cryptomeria japonica]
MEENPRGIELVKDRVTSGVEFEMKEKMMENGSEIEVPDQSPIEQVALTVPVTDDPTLPVLTFRTWFLGIICCASLAFLNQFFGYRTIALTISSVAAQIAVLPVGRFMAAVLPTKELYIPGTKWSFSMNPGPFNMKEHVLITIFASAGSGGVYAVGIFTIIKAFYHINIDPLAAWLLIITTQMLGFGWAGLFRRFLVEGAYMWWPANLVQVSLFRALHEKERRPRGGLTRMQFFMTVMTCSFAYYVIPNVFFPVISNLSILCYILKKSVTAQQIGSGFYGLGIGSFGLDWNTIAGFLGTPLATPFFAIANVMVGFTIIVYVLTPILYWNNVYDAKKFPIIDSALFARDGTAYNVSRILGSNHEFDEKAYNDYSPIHLTAFFAVTYGVGFAALSATLSHVFLFHGKEIWRQTKATLKDTSMDVHTRLMRTNYKPVPQWWFLIVLIVMMAGALWACEGFNKQLQLPWWGILFACALASFFTLPIGIITATTNQQPGLNIITEYFIGYLYPGRPFANVSFKTYGYISMVQALAFLGDFKLGHYMKIPPRSMFLVQISGTAIASTVYYLTSWWLLDTVPHICTQKNSNFTCPGDRVFYNASVIWGVVGPRRMFGNLGLYEKQNWFFLAGAVAPLIHWLLRKKFPNVKLLQYIHMPILIGATGNMPPTRSVNFVMWGLVGFIFNYIIFNRYKKWWVRHNYILSAGMDAGVAFLAILAYFSLQYENIGINGTGQADWWGSNVNYPDYCLVAACPTDPTVPMSDDNSMCPQFN